jgi:hypothetical protein
VWSTYKRGALLVHIQFVSALFIYLIFNFVILLECSLLLFSFVLLHYYVHLSLHKLVLSPTLPLMYAYFPNLSTTNFNLKALYFTDSSENNAIYGPFGDGPGKYFYFMIYLVLILFYVKPTGTLHSGATLLQLMPQVLYSEAKALAMTLLLAGISSLTRTPHHSHSRQLPIHALTSHSYPYFLLTKLLKVRGKWQHTRVCE